MDPQLPRVPERLDLLDLAASVLEFSVLDVAGARRGLPVRVELDPLRRVDIDHLHLAAQRLSLGE